MCCHLLRVTVLYILPCLSVLIHPSIHCIHFHFLLSSHTPSSTLRFHFPLLRLTRRQMHTTHFPHFTRHTLPSGLTAYHIPAPGPLVHGTFALATEAFDDKGCPHVLEHLVFMGSKKYPYKGVLDKVANRCIARGTNAWTATDHSKLSYYARQSGKGYRAAF